ncbi:MAG: M4 family metallopeptidase [Ferruginibacter sp.]|nr:M4 family metallopeptidase [Ferruginibacter sp.]
MKNKIILVTLVTAFFAKPVFAQTDTLFWNNEMIKIATPNSSAHWINIKPGISIKPSAFFISQKKALGLGVNDEMRLFKTENDNLGMTHYRYQQFYKGYKIFFGEYFLHEKQGEVTLANGRMIKGLKKNPLINISKTAALKSALQFLPAVKYAWEIAELENNYKEILHDKNASYKPVGELVWITNDKNDDKDNAAKYELAYSFDIFTASMDGKRIFISAASGTVIQSYPLVYKCDATSVTTNFYSTQGFSTSLIPGSSPARWNLWNDCQPAFIRTLLWATGPPYSDYVSSAGNNWTAFPSAATSHWCTEKSYNYFLSIHGRNGWNNANGGVYVYQDAFFPCGPAPAPCPNGQNASFSGGSLAVGNNSTSPDIDDFNTLDFIAHEFTHGVTASSFANLVYSKESGALNESFSDIFGVTCHASLFGLSSNTWLVGFDRKNALNTSQSLYVRNMANPKDKRQPDTYKSEPEWYNVDSTDAGNDKWGVHSNSGVQNYMYYLLTTGGSGANDYGTPFSLIGIGMVAARAIAYRALTVGYLFSTSDFAQARTAWVHAAIDLYGECSLQAIEVGKAWNAVGLPPPVINQSSPYCGTYGGSVFSLTNPNIFSLAPGCAMTVVPASLVQFGANKVILNPGFRANNGSNFRAYISDCRFAAY